MPITVKSASKEVFNKEINYKLVDLIFLMITHNFNRHPASNHTRRMPFFNLFSGKQQRKKHQQYYTSIKELNNIQKEVEKRETT